MVYRLDEGGMGSEDFASYGYELPCAYLLLGAGAALHTWCAVNFLKAE